MQGLMLASFSEEFLNLPQELFLNNFIRRDIDPCAVLLPAAVWLSCQMLDLLWRIIHIWLLPDVCVSLRFWDSSTKVSLILFIKEHCLDSKHRWPRGCYTSARIIVALGCTRIHSRIGWNWGFKEPCTKV